MKTLIILTLIALMSSLRAEDKPKSAGDPFAGALFPPELVFMAKDRITLTPKQEAAIRTNVEKTQQRAEELRTKLEAEASALGTLVKQEHIDEAALHKQLDKVLDLERETKHVYIGLMVTIKNVLMPEQQAKLREIAGGGLKQLGADVQKRLMEKMERVKESAQQMASSGRDPSEILKTMEQTFKPVMDAGKVIEAEAELDRVLEQLTKEAK